MLKMGYVENAVTRELGSHAGIGFRNRMKFENRLGTYDHCRPHQPPAYNGRIKNPDSHAVTGEFATHTPPTRISVRILLPFYPETAVRNTFKSLAVQGDYI
jgi:hypothetical protein